MSKDDKKSTKKAVLKDVGMFALKTAAISGAVLGGVAIALPAAGFTAGGVAAGSLAASFQSAFLGGTIASGSTFAILQSVGAAGLAASTQAGVVLASAVTSAAHTVYKKGKSTNSDNDANTFNGGGSNSKKCKDCSRKIEDSNKKDREACNDEKGKEICSCGKIIESDSEDDKN